MILKRELHQSSTKNAHFKFNLANSYCKLAKIYSASGDLNKSVTLFERAIILSVKNDKSYPEILNFKNNLAITYFEFGQFYLKHLADKEKAQKYFLKSNNLWSQLIVSSPTNFEYQKRHKECLSSL